MTISPSLFAWARHPGPVKVLAAARRRLEGGHGLTRGSLRVALTPAERDEVGQLLGVRWTLSGRGVGAKALVDAVAAAGGDLVELLTTLGGPVRNRPAERAGEQASIVAERTASLDILIDAGVSTPAAEAWVASRASPKAGTGRLAAVARAAAAVWRRLPFDGPPILLPMLADQALGDPHGLDRGAAPASAVLRLARGELPPDAHSWRAAWDDLGVVCDPLSSRVLVLNLPLTGLSAAARLASAAPGEPVWLTWRSLADPVACPAPDVYVCENPSVVAEAADTLGSRSRPLVCTNGRPSATTRRLLTELAAAGARLHVRADDDAIGQTIVAGLLRLPGSTLWRYERRDPAQARATPRYEERDIPALLRDLR